MPTTKKPTDDISSNRKQQGYLIGMKYYNHKSIVQEKEEQNQIYKSIRFDRTFY